MQEEFKKEHEKMTHSDQNDPTVASYYKQKENANSNPNHVPHPTSYSSLPQSPPLNIPHPPPPPEYHSYVTHSPDVQTKKRKKWMWSIGFIIFVILCLFVFLVLQNNTVCIGTSCISQGRVQSTNIVTYTGTIYHNFYGEAEVMITFTSTDPANLTGTVDIDSDLILGDGKFENGEMTGNSISFTVTSDDIYKSKTRFKGKIRSDRSLEGDYEPLNYKQGTWSAKPDGSQTL